MINETQKDIPFISERRYADTEIGKGLPFQVGSACLFVRVLMYTRVLILPNRMEMVPEMGFFFRWFPSVKRWIGILFHILFSFLFFIANMHESNVVWPKISSFTYFFTVLFDFILFCFLLFVQNHIIAVIDADLIKINKRKTNYHNPNIWEGSIGSSNLDIELIQHFDTYLQNSCSNI